MGELAEASGLEPESVAMALDSLAPVLSLSYAGEEGASPLFELLGDDPTQSMLDKAAVGSALDKLPERQKKLVLLRYYRSKTHPLFPMKPETHHFQSWQHPHIQM